ncbi:MAG TPA: tetratricopeptide repeat protein [Oscillatoriaceae cyanobacterium M33_DOE_052]|uniref:Tetratricopeptide repeat protein n=1 Tax=Planktothricoides sp. SpSt-374 TaxID=2282167 RepID=A0A7C3ZNT5_9CYAN|nr:tetratricopeptide repeat protein [Oscillatoriaceae cyanobacterium M33_DOE_052]
MQTLYINLDFSGKEEVELSYYTDNPASVGGDSLAESFTLPAEEIADLMKMAERKYGTLALEECATTGRKLYQWLDANKWLSRVLSRLRGQCVVLAIAAGGKMAYLPWETLHDTRTFLVQRQGGAVVPVRWLPDVGAIPSSTLEAAAILASAKSSRYGGDEPADKENQKVRVLFMASSPLNTLPVMNLEAEEVEMLAATQNLGGVRGEPPPGGGKAAKNLSASGELELTVEESGCLVELARLVDFYGADYFDVLHLRGNTILFDGEPQFISETETGAPHPANAEAIAETLQFYWPPLVFLSACRTGALEKEEAPSAMAEALLNQGATAVLVSWRLAGEKDAAGAAAVFYGSCAAGENVVTALANTYSWLMEKRARDWYWLRLYVAGAVPGVLVTPTPGGQTSVPVVQYRSLDDSGRVIVPAPSAFVGRRRMIQKCCAAIGSKSERVGVLLTGPPGAGKSSIAARLCDAKGGDYQTLVWVGALDEASLVERLSRGDSLFAPTTLHVHDLLNGCSPLQWQRLLKSDEPLKLRLRKAFAADMAAHAMTKPWLLVFDEFEYGNLERRGERWWLTRKAAEILEALVFAIRDAKAPHRIIITCEELFEWSWLAAFHLQPVEKLSPADVLKICRRLPSFSGSYAVKPELLTTAENLADGNPRILEWFDQVLQSKQVDAAAIMEAIAPVESQRRAEVLAQELLAQLLPESCLMLKAALIYHLPVPPAAVAALATHITNPSIHLRRAAEVGLLNGELSGLLNSRGANLSEGIISVPKVVARVLQRLPASHPGHSDALYGRGAVALYRLWYSETDSRESVSDEKLLEIHRLAQKGLAHKPSAEEAKLPILLANIATQTALVLLARWKHQELFEKSVSLATATLAVIEDYRIRHRLAAALKQLAQLEAAEASYRQALELCPPEDLKEKASIVHNLAILLRTKGMTVEALRLYEQSLQLKESIGNTRGRAATLHQLANLKAEAGQIEEAIALYQQSLSLKESDGNLRSRAATLAMLGQLMATERGDTSKALDCLQESLRILVEVGAPEALQVQEMIAHLQ